MSEYQVESIVNDFKHEGITYYEIKWVMSYETTNETVDNLTECNDALQRYLKLKKGSKRVSLIFSSNKINFILIFLNILSISQHRIAEILIPLG